MPRKHFPVVVESTASSVPRDIAGALGVIGPVIAPGPTSALYAPLHDVLANPGVEVIRDISYGAHERHLLDVFVKSGGRDKLPVLVFIHGGGFVGGNKSGPATPFYDNVMYWACRQGMIGVNASYRLAPAHQWPAVQEDLHSVMQWVGTHIGSYGGDTGRVFLVGHSAGAAHVVQYIAHCQTGTQENPGIRGAMLVSGIFDPSSFAEQAMVQSYFGTDVAAMAQRNAISAMALADIPFLFTYAELDPPSFRAQTLKAAGQLQQAGRLARCVALTGHNHLSAVYAVGTRDSSLSDAWLRFMEEN